MKKTPKYLPFNSYLIRTPLLSNSEVSNLTYKELIELCKKDHVSEAIYIASPELHNEMQKMINGFSVKDKDKLTHTLLKYLLRMSNRCTPFGLFSGCAIGEFSNENNIEIDSIEKHKRLTRLDMNFLCELAQNIDNNRKVRENLLYYKNTTLYRISENLRYIEYRYEKTFRRHFTVSIDFSDFIENILSSSKKGTKIDKLAALILEMDNEIPFDAAINFVHELIDSQILISSISPSVTGEGYFDVLIKKLSMNELHKPFSNINAILKKINNKPIGEGFILYDDLAKTLEPLNTNYDKKYLLQTDLHISFNKNTIRRTVLSKINSCLGFLNKLNFIEQNKELDEFKTAFYNKYEDEEIPLALALDVESGIGYPVNKNDASDISPLIDDLNMFVRKVSDSLSINEIKWNKKDQLLNQKLLSALKEGNTEIQFTDEDVKDFEENWNNLPDTLSVMANMLEVDQERELIQLNSIGGATATYLLGRFCHLDSQINSFVKKIIEVEESNNEESIYAEILHLPEKRAGNILYRPQLRKYEIPYLAKSNLPSENQINIDDLLISVKNEEIFLRSKSHNKRVLPRMATAHNYSGNGLPIYYFLCDLQYQNIRSNLSFSWGNLYVLHEYFPRVTFKGIVLSLATWIVKQDVIKHIISNRESLNNWKIKNKIPSQVLLKDGDNELAIDFNHDMSVEMFSKTIKNKLQIILTENIFNPKKALVKSKNKPFTNELILAYHRNRELV